LYRDRDTLARSINRSREARCVLLAAEFRIHGLSSRKEQSLEKQAFLCDGKELLR